MLDDGRASLEDVRAVRESITERRSLEDIRFNCGPDRRVQLWACARRLFLGKTPPNATDALKLKEAVDLHEIVMPDEKYLQVLAVAGPS